MPHIKKDAIEAVIQKLEAEKGNIGWAIMSNKRAFRKLTEEQTSLKRQRVVLQNLIRGLKNPSE